jgi:hypothetical protein
MREMRCIRNFGLKALREETTLRDLDVDGRILLRYYRKLDEDVD